MQWPIFVYAMPEFLRAFAICLPALNAAKDTLPLQLLSQMLIGTTKPIGETPSMLLVS